jgi:hypothetical protein
MGGVATAAAAAAALRLPKAVVPVDGTVAAVAVVAAGDDDKDDFSVRLRGTEPKSGVGCCLGVAAEGAAEAAAAETVAVVVAGAITTVSVVVAAGAGAATVAVVVGAVVVAAVVGGGDVTTAVVVVVLLVLDASGGRATSNGVVVWTGATTAGTLGRRIVGAGCGATTSTGVETTGGTWRPMGRLACWPLYGAKSVKLLENQRCSAGMRRGGCNEVFIVVPPPFPNTPDVPPPPEPKCESTRASMNPSQPL